MTTQSGQSSGSPDPRHPPHPRRSITGTLRGSSLVRFGALSLTVLGALFWARQKLISPTPKMAVADPQATQASAPRPPRSSPPQTAVGAEAAR